MEQHLRLVDDGQELPTPPFPTPNDPALQLVVDQALEALRTGETDVRGAVLYAAVHGWSEGHLAADD